MKIALVGGTGDMGMGFAPRWAKNHEIIIGSRNLEKAEKSATEVLHILGDIGNVWGTDNAGAIENGNVVVLCVPYEHLSAVTYDLKNSYSDQILISPIVPMIFNGRYFEFTPPKKGCAALQARSLLPRGTNIISAFHTVPAAALKRINKELHGDVLICGDDKGAKDVVMSLAKEIENLRPLDAGPLSVSGQLENLTPMLLNVARKNSLKEAGIKVIEES
ncbi:MAG: NADPH-dependent F420 reductase [Methanotrichaceae archaeon]|nr:NADPH-dependent F420 reductase [Methanotrichaceae archaeon]